MSGKNTPGVGKSINTFCSNIRQQILEKKNKIPALVAKTNTSVEKRNITTRATGNYFYKNGFEEVMR